MIIACRHAAWSCAALFAIAVGSGPAFAAGQRSFVSTLGADNPACSLATPCRSFGAAIAATSPAGEVIVLDSGGYGPVVITTAITITAPKGVYAGISTFAGTGVAVSLAVATDVVTLRGLTVTGLGGSTGISFNGTGSLHMADSVVTGFVGSAIGLLFTPTGASNLRLDGCRIDGNNDGVFIAGGGGLFQTSVLIENTSVSDNSVGIAFNDTVVATLRDTTVARSATNGIIFDQQIGSTKTYAEMIRSTVTQSGSRNVWIGDPSSGSGTSVLLLRESVVDRGAEGLRAGDRSTTYLSNSVISANTLGISYGSIAAFVQSQGNNFIAGNGADGGAPTIIGSK